MRYPPKERHVFTFEEMFNSNEEESSLDHDTG